MNKKKEVIYNRSVPFNTEAEVYVLGSIFIDNKIIDGLIGKLEDIDFYDQRNVMIYRAMVNLRKSGGQIDVLSVVEELKRLNYNDVPNISNYLVEIIDSVPSIASVKLYIEIVEEKAELATVSEKVVYEDNELIVTVKESVVGFAENQFMFPLNLSFKNKTNTELTVSEECVLINDVFVEHNYFLNVTMNPKETVEYEWYFEENNYKRTGIHTIGSISFGLIKYEKNGNDYKTSRTDLIRIESDHKDYVQKMNTEGTVLIDEQGFKIVAQEAELDVEGEKEYNCWFYLENNTDKGTWFQIEKMSVNGFVIKTSTMPRDYVPANTKGYKSILFTEDDIENGDQYTTSKILAEYLKDKDADLIIAGNVAIDSGSGQVGPRVAELLGIPYVTTITSLEIDGTNASVVRDVEGDSETIETSLPLLVTAQQGLNEPRYPSLPGIMKAKKKPLEELEIDDLDIDEDDVEAKTKTIEIYLPPQKEAGKVLEGELKDQVTELVTLLNKEAKVI